MTGDGGGEDKKYFSMYIESSVKNKTILHHRCKIVLLHVDFYFFGCSMRLNQFSMPLVKIASIPQHCTFGWGLNRPPFTYSFLCTTRQSGVLNMTASIFLFATGQSVDQHEILRPRYAITHQAKSFCEQPSTVFYWLCCNHNAFCLPHITYILNQ